MAKTINFTDLTAPTNLSGIPVSGGTLAANTTYYYNVFAVNSTSTTIYVTDGKSLPSDEISVTTTSTDKSVTLTFNCPKGEAGGYRIFRTTSPINADEINRPLNSAVLDSVYNTDGTITFTDTGIGIGGNMFYDDKAHGTITLEGSVSDDKFSIVDLYNADVAGGWGVIEKIDVDTYVVKARILGHTGMYWADINKTIILFDQLFPGSGSNFEFGTISGTLTRNGCTIISKSWYLNSFVVSNLNAYLTVFRYDKFNLNYWNIGFNSGEVIDCDINKVRGFKPYNKNNCSIINMKYAYCDNAFSTGLGTFTNVYMIGGSRPFQTNSVGTTIRAEGLVLNGTSLAVLIIHKDCEITFVNTNVDSSKFNVSSYNVFGSFVDEMFTYDLTVYDSSGVIPISGADVKIWDAFGTLVTDTTTDYNGQIVQQEFRYQRHTYSDNLPSIRSSTKYAPYKLIISKSGYDDYIEYTDYDGSYETKKTYALKPTEPPIYVNQYINGSIENNSLIGNVDETSLIGNIETNTLFGTVEQDNINTTISSHNTLGSI